MNLSANKTQAKLNAPDWLVAPTNDTEQTCIVQVDVENLYKDWKSTGRLRFEIEIYDLQGQLVKSINANADSYFSYAKKQAREYLKRLDSVDNDDEERFYRFYLGASIASHALMSCVATIKGMKNFDPSKFEKKLYHYFSKNEFRLVITCDNNDFCHGVIENTHLALKSIYRHSKIKYPTAKMVEGSNRPIPTTVPPDFETDLVKSVYKQFLINFEIEGFHEGIGIAGFFSIHDETNPSTRTENEKVQFTEHEIDKIMKIFHPWEKTND